MTPALPDRAPPQTYNDVRGSFNKYRSIAYGTWKPNEAKRFSEKAKRRQIAAAASQKAQSESLDLFQIRPKPQQRDLCGAVSNDSLDCPTLVPTEDEVDEISDEIENCKTEPILRAARLHQCAQTTPSLGLQRRQNHPNNNTNSSTMTVSFEPDCYSSQDYINYYITSTNPRTRSGSSSNNQGFSTLPLGYHSTATGMNRSMDALNDRLIHSTNDFSRSLRKQRPSTSASVKQLDPFCNLPLHKRTRSFDGATHFAVIAPTKNGKLSTYGQKPCPQKTGAFQATKNFIKKLYNNSTTLPKKLKSGKSQQKLDRIKAATSPFYEMRYPEPEEIPYLPYNIQYEVESEANDEETEMDISNEEFDSSVGAPSCSSSTQEKSINGGHGTHDEGIFSGSDEKSQTGSDFTAPSCVSSSNRSTVAIPPHAEQFQSWNDLFGHLKKEITEMRARDAQILENLKTVESQLSHVRIDRSRSEYSPLSKMLNSPSTIPAGSRESTSTATNNNNKSTPLRSTFV